MNNVNYWYGLVLVGFLMLPFVRAKGQPHVRTDYENASGSIEILSDTMIRIIPQMRNGDVHAVWFRFSLEGLEARKRIKLRLSAPKRGYMPQYLYIKDGDSSYQAGAKLLTGEMNYEVVPQGHTLEVATGYPYTVSDSKNLLDRLSIQGAIDVSVLAKTKAHNKVLYGRTPDQKQLKSILLIGRQHAFEAPGSYTFAAMMVALATDPAYAKFRTEYRLYFVPIMDVDMVIDGGTGKDQSPIDFNRSWTENSPWPAVRAVQTLAKKLSKSAPIVGFMDIHTPFPFDAKGPHYYNAYPDSLPIKSVVDNLFADFAARNHWPKLPIVKTNYPPPKPGECVVRNYFSPLYRQNGNVLWPAIRMSATYEQAWGYPKADHNFTPDELGQIGTNLAAALVNQSTK